MLYPHSLRYVEILSVEWLTSCYNNGEGTGGYRKGSRLFVYKHPSATQSNGRMSFYKTYIQLGRDFCVSFPGLEFSYHKKFRSTDS